MMVQMLIWMVIRALSLVRMGPGQISLSVSVKMGHSSGQGGIGSRMFSTGSRTSLDRIEIFAKLDGKFEWM